MPEEAQPGGPPPPPAASSKPLTPEEQREKARQEDIEQAKNMMNWTLKGEGGRKGWHEGCHALNAVRDGRP